MKENIRCKVAGNRCCEIIIGLLINDPCKNSY